MEPWGWIVIFLAVIAGIAGTITAWNIALAKGKILSKNNFVP